MKESQQPLCNGGLAPHTTDLADEGQAPGRTLPSTADILARGVTLAQVQAAVRRLRPPVDRERAG